MAYALDNALYQWGEGDGALSTASGRERDELERAVRAVYEELRRRLAPRSWLRELAELYGEDRAGRRTPPARPRRSPT